MDLEDRSPEPAAPAAEPEPGPEPEPEPAFPDMELESPTHDMASPANPLAGDATSVSGLGRIKRDTLLCLCQQRCPGSWQWNIRCSYVLKTEKGRLPCYCSCWAGMQPHLHALWCFCQPRMWMHDVLP